MANIIHYGIGKDYLSHWGINEALREVFQNFLDWGDYTIDTSSVNDDIRVTISNSYVPEGLEFLRIGYSNKRESKAIGKYGEGLKMAALIFARENRTFEISTNHRLYRPLFIDNGGIGECFAVRNDAIETVYDDDKTFEIKFQCSKKDYCEFIENVITDDDVIYEDNSNGRIVNKPVGHIYSGGLFIAKVDNLTRAYDIYPHNMSLDRDRKVPRQFDVEYHTSKLNNNFDKWDFKDQEKTDVKEIESIPERLHKQVDLVKSGNSTIVVYKDDDGSKKPIQGYKLQTAARKIPHIAKKLDAIKRESKRARVKPHATCKTVSGAIRKLIKAHDVDGNLKVDLLDVINRMKHGKLK